MVIPLLRLPSLAAYEVFKSMDCRSLFTVSLLSQNIQRIVKRCIPKNSIKIQLIQGVNLTVQTGNLILNVHQKLSKSRRTRYSVKNIYFLHGSVSWYTRDTAGVVEFLTATFNLPTVSLNFLLETNEERALKLLRITKEHKLPISLVSYKQKKTSSKVFKEILNECKTLSDVMISTSLRPDFEFRPASPKEFCINSFHLAGSTDWLHLDDFMGCQKLKIHGCGFPRDVSSSLRKMVTSVTTLKYVEIQFQNDLDLQATVDIIMKGDVRWKVRNQREDGKMVSLKKNSTSLFMVLED